MAKRTRRSRSRSDSKASLILGIMLIVGALAATSGVVAYYLLSERAPKLNAETLCPLDGARGITVLLVDTSDDLPGPAKQEVLRYLRDIAEVLPAYYLLDIRTLDVANKGSRRVFSKCNPGNGVGVSEWTGNPAIIKKRWLELFEGPFIQALRESVASSATNSSPIMAAIQQIAIDRFTGKAADSIPKKLIVVSDMIEHSPPDYSQYCSTNAAPDLSFDRFQRTPAYLRYRTDLHQAETTVMYITRRLRCKLDYDAHAQFWGAWIKDSRGKIGSFRRLQGVG